MLDTEKKRNLWIGILFVVVLSVFIVCYGKMQKPEEPITATAFKLNTVVKVTIYDSQDEKILQDALALCDKYEKIFSRTRTDSEIYLLNEGKLPQEDGYYILSEECAELIGKGLYYSELSGGAFDITIEPLSSLWDFTSGEKQIPDPQTLVEAQKHVGYEKVELKGNKIRFQEDGMGLELGAIAKGYIADKIKEFLISEGIESAVIDLGGNVLCIGTRPDGEAFRVGIQKPFADRNETVATAGIRDRSVVSSGIYERYFEKDGKLYHHILNPKSGYPYENGLTAVTILSDESVDGDGLSTVCFALGLEKGLELINSLSDTQAVFITEDGELHYSEHFEEEVPLNYE
ncbi:FAD:protein FMN transferase [Mediterraneibacter glycyrrhizinilyticus]|uniref:FAD:protein FMN transferase n=1 Tax=Mediterraneibacter glycyrrhizinilyticus TaxID=342942 RepID=UPI001D062926|nr:FAD:protein FMN transferase [Mediterraneibacter glycyrrhizinilyticus]MCB6310495.1 FAD:protein FMN transferase [Lachnospiraceae bacterium 210521-DFI.1.109]MCB6428022.1 FAD:protein FMN transferase [Mediterraneibacter glycyrrhizinilyticus]